MEFSALFFTVTSKLHGQLPGHQGNWHTAWLNYEGDDDGVTGAVDDWQCDPGVEPAIANGVPPTCVRLSSTWVEEAVGGRATVRWSPRLRHFVVSGTVTVIDRDGNESTGKVRILGRATAGSTYTARVLDWTDGLGTFYRDVEASRDGAKACGHVLSFKLCGPGKVVEVGAVSSYTSYRLTP